MFHATDYKAPDPKHWPKDWQECYQHFLAHLWERSRSEHTVLRYSSELTRFFNGADKPPQAITRQDVMAYASRASLVGPVGAKSPDGPPAQPRTHNTRVAIIASFYKFACGYECADAHGKFSPLTERNPAMGIAPTRESPAHRTMTSEEFERFIGAIPRDGEEIHARDRAMFLSLWWTCRRRSELCSLTWASIEKTTFIVNQVTRATREGWKYTFKNKGGGIYSAELPGPAAQAIFEYIDISKRVMEPDSPLFASVGPPGGGFIRDPFLGLSAPGLYMRMKHYLRIAKMDESAYSPHSIRHSGALARYRAGSGPMEIMHTLNHRNLNTTMVYVRELDVSQDTGALLLMDKYGNL